MSHHEAAFLCGCAPAPGVVVVARALDPVADAGKASSAFFAVTAADSTKYDYLAPWTPVAMAVAKPAGGTTSVVAVGPRGQYFEVDLLSREERHGVIRQVAHPVRSLATIDGVVFAVGLGRSVLTRTRSGLWKDLGPDAEGEDTHRVVGFEDVAGFTAAELYAVGWYGEVWQRTRAGWRRQATPVASQLNAIHCADDGYAYIVGDDGVMLRGRGTEWVQLPTGRTDNLVDVAIQRGTLYATTEQQILKWTGAQLVPDDAFLAPHDRPQTCKHLLPAPDGLVSLGARDLFRLVDGGWQRIA